MTMQKRPGLTVIELLMAMLIGGGIVTLAIQQTFNYMRLQATLMTRTQLRAECKVAQDKVDQRLRYAIMLENGPKGDGYIIVVPNDVDRCGRLCYMDTYDLYWWRLKPDPFGKRATGLTEQQITLPAFKDEPDVEELAKLFEAKVGGTHQVAGAVSLLQIGVEGTHIYHSVIGAQRDLAGQPPVQTALQEMIAPRSMPVAMDGMPTFKEVLEKLKKDDQGNAGAGFKK